MADEIDYDALDQALRGAIRHEKQPKVSTTRKKVEEKVETKPVAPVKPKPAPKPTARPSANSVAVKRRSTAPRGHYMDMVSSSRPARAQKRPQPVRRTSATPKQRTVARPTSPISAPPATQTLPLVPIAYTQDGTPIVYTQPSAPQVAQPAPAPVPQAPAPSPVLPTPEANLPVETTPAPAPAVPAPEETPLGTRSPYMVNTQVDKRPLSTDVKAGIDQIYGQPNEQKPEAAEKAPAKAEKKESSIDWKWILTMVIVVIAGAIAGYLFYILFADKLPF